MTACSMCCSVSSNTYSSCDKLFSSITSKDCTMDEMSMNLEACRTCLNAASAVMHGLSESLDAAATVADALNLCTSLKVAEGDGLPNKLCSGCYNCLMSFYHFRKVAEQVDIQLRDQIEDKRIIEHLNTSHNIVTEFNDIKVEVSITNAKDEVDCDILNADVGANVKQEFSFIDDSDDNFTNDFTFDECNNTEDVKVNLKCELCYRKFTSLDNLKKHLKRNSCDSTYTCNICSRTFKRHHKYLKHLVIHGQDIAQDETEQNEQRCSVCLAKFKSVNSLTAHMRKHTKKGRILACSICGKLFKKVSHVKRHELCHEVNRPFKCSLCPKRYNTESLLNEHMNKHNKVKPHICPICNKSFAHLSTLSTHVKLHTRDKPFLCSTCGKKFDSSTNLNQHLKRHVGLKMFACNMCPKTFVSKGELQSHGVTHSGARSWRCDQCGSSFTHRKSLNQHMRMHTGIKPHQCDTCPMRFFKKDHLKRHCRIHTGEKPYKCELCERAFTQSGDLLKHRRAHLGDKLYKCAECSEGFRLKSELRRHLSEHFLSSQSQTETPSQAPPPQRPRRPAPAPAPPEDASAIDITQADKEKI